MSDKSNGLSRRSMLAAAAGAALAPALGTPFATRGHAAAPKLGASGPTHYRFKHGDFEITTIYDGAVKIDKVHPIFGQNQDAEAVKTYMMEHHLPGDQMMIAFTPVIVNTGKEVVMFDAGNGAARRGKGAGHLAERLAAAGFAPDQIDVVVITHCHPDHIGGLMEGGKPLFPNARYFCDQVEYDFWSKKELAESSDKTMATRAQLVQSNVVPLAAKMSFIKPGTDVVTGITSLNAYGHTPGHTAFHIESGNARFLWWADVTNHYVASLQKPEWHVVFDMDKEAAVASRKRVLSMVASDRLLAGGYHMPFPAVGFVEQKGDEFRWAPASYQLEL